MLGEMAIVTALVCTKNRARAVLRAVTSLLAHGEPPHELIVVDQSATRDAEQALNALGDPRLRYIHTSSVGKGAALNVGLSEARGEIVVCTDDDCEAPPGWVASMARALEEHPRAAVVFSNVVALPYDKLAGYVPTYERASSRELRSVLDLCAGYGLGAGMALRRSAILGLGGCDEAMGPGGRFPSADDIDLAIRALQLGWHVHDTAETSIVHHGFRSFADSRDHVHRDWLALGATCSKSLRGRRPLGAVPTFWLFTRQALWPPIVHLVRLEKPSGLTRITAFLKGFASGMLVPVDRTRMVFMPKESTTTRSTPAR